jgi:hypothetical protein
MEAVGRTLVYRPVPVNTAISRAGLTFVLVYSRPAMPATIYLIGGCNGAGKTTFARDFLPAEVKCLRFFNADEIARGLSPLDPSAGQIKAGRRLLQEVRTSIAIAKPSPSKARWVE